jgi:hypothetical protein
MCDVRGCTNTLTKKVLLITETPMDKIKRTIYLCDEHWVSIKGQQAYSMGCHITNSKPDTEIGTKNKIIDKGVV